MNMRKTICRIFGGIFLCMILFNVSVNADAAKKSGNFEYESDKNGITITDYTGKEKKVKIPETINGRKVVEIDTTAFKKNKTVRKIIMPDSVESIGYQTFAQCEKLKSIRLSKNLTDIDACAFSGCKSLKKVVLPKTVTLIPYGCFRRCESLESINLENVEDIGVDAFYRDVKLCGVINLTKAVSVGDNAFNGCAQIAGVNFSEMLQVLGTNDSFDEKTFIPGQKSSNTFAYCEQIQYFNVPDSNANFKSIDGVIFGKTGEWIIAFPGGKTGTYIAPETTKGIARYAFAGAHISEVVLSDNVYAICRGAFQKSHIIKMNLPKINEDKGVVWEDSIFSDCTDLVSFSFPENATTTGKIKFSGCSSLKDVYLPETLTEIKGGLFATCTSLEKVVIPKGIKRIPAECFYSCTALKEINLDNIETIGVYAFYNCTSLQGSLKLNAKSVGCKAFEKCIQITDVEFLVPLEETGICSEQDYGETWWIDDLDYLSGTYSNPFAGCSSLTKITVPDGVRTKSIDGVLYSQDMKILLAYPCAKGGRFIMPYGVAEIASYAFDGASVSEIITSNSVEILRDYAICNSAVSSVSISKSVEEIENTWDDGVFSNCRNLKEIIVKKGNDKYTSIDGVLFEGNKLLCYPAKKAGKTYKVPQKSKIGMYAFSDCKYLKKVIIPEGMKECTKVYFRNCRGIKAYMPKSLEMIVGYMITRDGLCYVFGENCKKCTVYAHKNAPYFKELKKQRKNTGINIKYY